MGEKKLESIILKDESEMYIDALHSVLTQGGLFKREKFMLNGMTGMVFKFIVQKNLILPSPYMYHIGTSSFDAVDRLGIYTQIFEGYKMNPTFILHQKKAIVAIKQSINSGVGALFWDPGDAGFGAIYGYDDEEEVFFYRDRRDEDVHIMLYSNLGKVRATYWMCQIIGDKIEKDIRDVYTDSLLCATDEWENPNNVAELSKHEYGSGKKAYDFLVNALAEDNFSQKGACRIIDRAILSRRHIYLYIKEVEKEYPLIGNVVKKYSVLNDVYDEIAIKAFSNSGSEKNVTKNRIPALIENFNYAKEIEDAAIKLLKEFLKETLHNRHIDFYDIKKFI